MMFDQIEKLKQELTDKYVIVDARAPELMRFDGHVGQVKTVNMNGRALVQFDAWNNIGWYDIDVDSLQVVPKPAVSSEDKKHEPKGAAAPKPAAKPAAAAGEKKLSPLELARMQGAAKTGAAPSKPDGEKTAPAVAAKKSTADVLAAARGATAATPAAKLSTADILAAARAKKAAEESPPAAAPAVVTSAVAASSKPPAAKPALAAGQRPSVPEILVWCRQHDAK